LSKRILVISPHPDDETLGCGGTLRSHVLNGEVVRVVFLTSGEQGGHGKPPNETVEMREAEAAQAAQILGVDLIEFWRLPDGALSATAETVGRLCRWVVSWQPTLIYAPHELEKHADHRAAATIVREVLQTEEVKGSAIQVRLYEVWTPMQEMDDIVDISEHVETKRAAIRAYRSQCEVLAFEDAILGLNRYRGEMHCWPCGAYAEIFRRMQP
jgi:LmbE family N-acetylglucosaminyl deacetylase